MLPFSRQNSAAISAYVLYVCVTSSKFCTVFKVVCDLSYHFLIEERRTVHHILEWVFFPSMRHSNVSEEEVCVFMVPKTHEGLSEHQKQPEEPGLS